MIISPNIPEIRTSERNDLIQKLTEYLRQDETIMAVWIAGSIARGEDDWLSDIDIYVAVADESIESVVRDRHEFAARFSNPTLSMDHMRNAPPEGAYLLVHYPGQFGPQHVDWFWQPESLASIPDNGRLLFDKAGLSVIDGNVWENQMNQTGSRPAIDSTDPVDLATHGLQFFWAMGLIVAKYIVRGDDETVEYMLNMIARTLDGIVESFGLAGLSRDTLDMSGKAAQFHSLRAVSEQAKSLHEDLGKRGVVNPLEAIAQVEQFFDTCESVGGD
jgi:predicted nucleotidyltransferase